MSKTKFSIVKKMVVGITAVSAVTYGTSAFFIFVLRHALTAWMPDWLFIGITLALGVFWTGFLGWLAARWFVQPLLQLTSAANSASEGNLQVRIIPGRSDDELGALSVSFAKMIDKVREMMDGISNSFQTTDAHVDELRAAIGQAATHIERITSTVEAMSRGAERQSEASEAMFGSVEQMTRTAGDINEKADTARHVTRQMVATIEVNRKVIQTLAEGMQKLAASNRESIDVVRSLESNAKEIGEISNVVGELSHQTHLLALNASIEAARAGEHGKGFAVVAAEVKKLAAQSALAVNGINQLIDRIQAEVRNVVIKFTEQFEIAGQESAHGEAVAAALQTMIGEAGKVARTVDHIASMVSNQAEQIQTTLSEARDVADIASKICSGAREVFASTQEQTAVMEEIAASSELLSEQSAKLRRQIEFFKVS